MQVADIDAAKGRVATSHSLGIVHRGRDEIVDIQVLDVEGLAHLRTPRAQKAENLLAILDGIELSFDAIRRSRDLTERERGRKYLDEKSVHENAS
jgi:N-acetyl-beta-hexosaminidase